MSVPVVGAPSESHAESGALLAFHVRLLEPVLAIVSVAVRALPFARPVSLTEPGVTDRIGPVISTVNAGLVKAVHNTLARPVWSRTRACQ